MPQTLLTIIHFHTYFNNGKPAPSAFWIFV